MNERPWELMTPQQAASYLRVEPQTLARWHRAGKLEAVVTRGGHRRYRRADIIAMDATDNSKLNGENCE
jgi:excisionase family DNA binding protein